MLSRLRNTRGMGKKTSCIFKRSTALVTDQRRSLAGRPACVSHCETWHPARTSSSRHHISAPFSAPRNPLVGSLVLPLTLFKCGPFALKPWGKEAGLEREFAHRMFWKFLLYKIESLFFRSRKVTFHPCEKQRTLLTQAAPVHLKKSSSSRMEGSLCVKENWPTELRRPRRST